MATNPGGERLGRADSAEAYLAALVFDVLPVRDQMVLALAAYAAYVVNATQFLLKLRAARRQAEPMAANGVLGLAQ